MQTENEIDHWVRSFNWTHPPPNPDPGQVMRLKAAFWNVIRRNQHLYDSARKFGMLPLTKVAGTTRDLTFHVIFGRDTYASEGTLTWFHMRNLESILYHHPFSKIVIYSNTLSPDGFNVFTEAGYAITIKTYSITEMAEEAAVAGLTTDSLEQSRNISLWHIHEAAVLRTLIMYIYGGTYIDPDILLMKPVDTLAHDTIAYQSNGQTRRKVALMRFEKRHVLLRKLLERLVQCRESADMGCLYPIMDTTWATDSLKNIQVLDDNYLYEFQDMKSCCFLKLPTDSPVHDVLKADYYGAILSSDIADLSPNGKLTEGTICKILLNKFCVLCSNQY